VRRATWTCPTPSSTRFRRIPFTTLAGTPSPTRGLVTHTRLIAERSSIALARLTHTGVVVDAAFVDGSHRFHEVFVDLYFLRTLVRPGGLIVLDDTEWPSVVTALRYYDRNLGWTLVPIAGRLTARQLPLEPREPDFADFRPLSICRSPNYARSVARPQDT